MKKTSHFNIKKTYKYENLWHFTFLGGEDLFHQDRLPSALK